MSHSFFSIYVCADYVIKTAVNEISISSYPTQRQHF